MRGWWAERFAWFDTRGGAAREYVPSTGAEIFKQRGVPSQEEIMKLAHKGKKSTATATT